MKYDGCASLEVRDRAGRVHPYGRRRLRYVDLELSEIYVDGCITKAPCGGGCAGRSPVDRGKQGLKRSLASDACGVPIGLVAAGTNRHDSPLLGPTLEAAIGQVGPLPEDVNVNLDRGYDDNESRTLLRELGFTGEIAREGVPAPIQAGKRWTVERTHSWMKLRQFRRCTERNGAVVEFYLHLAATLVTLRMLIRHSTSRYRWDGRPTTRRLK